MNLSNFPGYDTGQPPAQEDLSRSSKRSRPEELQVTVEECMKDVGKDAFKVSFKDSLLNGSNGNHQASQDDAAATIQFQEGIFWSVEGMKFLLFNSRNGSTIF